MTPKIAILFVALNSLFAPLASSNPETAATLDARLHVTVHNYTLKASNIVEALTQVAKDFQIPMGIEWVDNSSARRNISVSWKDTTPVDIIHAIVARQSLHVLVESDVVRISSQLIPDRENPLKVKISEFAVQNVTTELAWRKLHEAVKQTISPPRPQAGGVGGIAGSGGSNIDDPKISVALKNVTVEDVLDALVLASARKIWIVTFSDAHTLTAAGYRRTLSLWSGSTVPDDEQPVWDLLHWGDAIPQTVLGEQSSLHPASRLSTSRERLLSSGEAVGARCSGNS